MKSFVCYDPSTGEIVTSGTCQDDDFDAQAIAGLSLLEGAGDPATSYVANGVITAYTSGQAQAKAARPSIFAQWSNSSFAWTDPRSTAALNEATIAALKRQILGQEAGQGRAVREIALALQAGTTPPSASVTRLQAIDTAIVALRAQIDALSG